MTEAEELYISARVSKGAAKHVEDTCDLILQKHGVVTPELFLEVTSSPDHPLHGQYIWEDSVAARQQRLDRARQLIAATKGVYVLLRREKNPSKKIQIQTPLVRKYLSIGKNEGYKERHVVLSEAETRQRFLQTKQRELRAWCASVIDVAEFDALRKAISEQLDTMG